MKVINLEKPSVILAINHPEREFAIEIGSYLANWLRAFKPVVYLVYTVDRELIKKASLADDEYFTVKERRDFIEEGCINDGNETVGKLKEIFSRYGIKCISNVEIDNPISAVLKTAKEVDAIGIIPIGFKISELMRKSQYPIIVIPEERERKIIDTIKEKIAAKIDFFNIILNKRASGG